ncbi:hypothetical protein ACHAXA_010063 [Cyclostephanos tholiformis]|uniref:Galectin n=1 Tax=Cyclostephanos tholiformis TaxID=382380 RepID=A0ABD3SF49_9STRA
MPKPKKIGPMLGNNENLIILPSGASYPSHLEPLTENERMLLDAYELVRQYEREASRLKAEEARRRLEEADERYRAKLRERESGGGEKNAGGGGDDDDDKDDVREGGGVVRGRGRDANEDRNDSDDDVDEGARKGGGGENENHDDDDDDDFVEEEEDAAIVERRRRREIEISRLRREVDAANLAKGRREAETEETRRREEAMRRELLGMGKDEDDDAGEDERGGNKKRRRPMDDHEDDDDEAGGYNDGDDDGDGRMTRSTTTTTKLIKKKRRADDDMGGASKAADISLIANLAGGDSTPVHDFSKRLGMGTTSADGSVLFPPPDGDDRRRSWCPPDAPRDFVDGCMELELTDVDPTFGDGGGALPPSSVSSGNNTIAIKFHAPKDSSRFSLNIATPDGRDGWYDNVLFHFNPRQFQRGGHLVLNDKTEKMWGNDVSVPLSTLPVMFGVDACTLVVQINEEGFDVFVEGVHCARLEHRRALPAAHDDGGGGQRRPSLILQFPSSDDYGNPESWLVYRVWWGRKRSMVDPEKLDSVAGVKIHSAVHPRRLFVSGLTKLHTDPEIDLRRAELERAFRKYGGPTGAVAVSLQKNSTFAFVDVATEGLADLALLEMASSGRYRVNKARRSRHEALLEERAAREAAEGGDGASTEANKAVDWD